jgi:hypothetical protein
MWLKHSEMLAPHTNQVGEWRETKTTKKIKPKRNFGGGSQSISKHLTM